MRTFSLLFICLILVSCMPATRQESLFSHQSFDSEFYSCPGNDIQAKSQEEGKTHQEQEGRLVAKSIYGTDDRKDWFESSDDMKNQWARSTLALIRNSNSKIKRIENGYYMITARSHGDRNDLCPGVAFMDQPTPALCSGFLIYDDLIVTAGHCLRNNQECRSTYFVFDFAKQREDQDEYRIPASSVYTCGEIVTRKKMGWDDFAVIRLDRPVTDRTPLKFRRQGSVSVGDELTLIGHPGGLPSKITEGLVKEVGPHFFASVDAISGSSGSPVINTRIGWVEGFLVFGNEDYKEMGSQEKDLCRVDYVCDLNGDECTGELITPISKVLAQIPQLCLL